MEQRPSQLLNRLSESATIAMARKADELGFDWVSVSEHHYAPYQYHISISYS